jgi:hypothetical protein
LKLQEFENDDLLALTGDRDWNETKTTLEAYKAYWFKFQSCADYFLTNSLKLIIQ